MKHIKDVDDYFKENIGATPKDIINSSNMNILSRIVGFLLILKALPNILLLKISNHFNCSEDLMRYILLISTAVIMEILGMITKSYVIYLIGLSIAVITIVWYRTK